jgi:hypothetical protein
MCECMVGTVKSMISIAVIPADNFSKVPCKNNARVSCSINTARKKAPNSMQIQMYPPLPFSHAKVYLVIICSRLGPVPIHFTYGRKLVGVEKTLKSGILSRYVRGCRQTLQ